MGRYLDAGSALKGDLVEFAGIVYEVVDKSDSFINPVEGRNNRIIALTLDHNGAKIKVTLDLLYQLKIWKDENND